MILPRHFSDYFVDPVLARLAREQVGLCNPSSRNLLMGTAIQESRLMYMRQIGGPALGFMQVEPATLQDTYDNFLDFAHNERIKIAVESFMMPDMTRRENLISSPCYGVAIARIKYWRHPAPLPEADDVQGLAEYWKRIYNTPEGAGKIQEFVDSYYKYYIGE